MPKYIAYDPETCEIKRRYEYTHVLDRGEGYVHVEIQPPMFPEAVIISKNSNNDIIISHDAEIHENYSSKYMKKLRQERNRRIAQTDYLFTSDFPHATPEKKQEWLDYRQALRDLPTATEDPANPVWPTAPTS